MLRLIPFAFASLVALTGCPGPDDGGDVVGGWRQVPLAGDDPADLEELTVNDDGTYARDVGGTPRDTGTYEIDGDRLAIHAELAGEEHEIEEGFVVDGDQLLVGTLTPDGDVDGVIGAWHGELTEDGVALTIDLDLRADGSVDYDATSSTEGDASFSGTWVDETGDLVVTLEVGTTQVAFATKYIPDLALGEKLYRRVP